MTNYHEFETFREKLQTKNIIIKNLKKADGSIKCKIYGLQLKLLLKNNAKKYEELHRIIGLVTHQLKRMFFFNRGSHHQTPTGFVSIWLRAWIYERLYKNLRYLLIQERSWKFTLKWLILTKILLILRSRVIYCNHFPAKLTAIASSLEKAGYNFLTNSLICKFDLAISSSVELPRMAKLYNQVDEPAL